MGLTGANLDNFVYGSWIPDEEDQGWDRFYKHVYDPGIGFGGFGGAPDACKEKMESAVQYAYWGNFVNAYQDLGRASHYLMDVGNPYRSNLLAINPLENEIKHLFYESIVESKWDEWDLGDIAYSARRIEVNDVEEAVKELARYSRQYKDELDSAIGVYYINDFPIPYIADEEGLEEVTKRLIRKTAGYTKGLIDNFNDNLGW
jgi:hypothetical protein